MKILTIIFLLWMIINQKITIHIIFRQKNLEGTIYLQKGPFQIMRKIAIVKRKRKHIVPSKRNPFPLDLHLLQKNVRHISLSTLKVSANIGLGSVLGTNFSIFVVIGLLEALKYQSLIGIQKYQYEVFPNYHNQLEIQLDIQSALKISIINLVLFYFKSWKMKYFPTLDLFI